MAKRIEAHNVSSYYGSFKAIDNISMTVEPKTITALIGPSGCGKSTFLRSVNRMHEVLPGARIEGRLTIDDQNIYDGDVDVTAVRRMIGMVFQRPPGRGPPRRPAAAALHRPHDRGRAAGRAHGRAVLGPRPDLHAGDRGPDDPAQGPLHDRDRHPQHAGGGPGQRH